MKLSPKGQFIIPAHIQRNFNIQKGTLLYFAIQQNYCYLTITDEEQKKSDPNNVKMVSSKGQVIFPLHIRKKFNVVPGDEILINEITGNKLLLQWRKAAGQTDDIIKAKIGGREYYL